MLISRIIYLSDLVFIIHHCLSILFLCHVKVIFEKFKLYIYLTIFLRRFGAVNSFVIINVLVVCQNGSVVVFHLSLVLTLWRYFDLLYQNLINFVHCLIVYLNCFYVKPLIASMILFFLMEFFKGRRERREINRAFLFHRLHLFFEVHLCS